MKTNEDKLCDALAKYHDQLTDNGLKVVISGTINNESSLVLYEILGLIGDNGVFFDLYISKLLAHRLRGKAYCQKSH